MLTCEALSVALTLRRAATEDRAGHRHPLLPRARRAVRRELRRGAGRGAVGRGPHAAAARPTRARGRDVTSVMLAKSSTAWCTHGAPVLDASFVTWCTVGLVWRHVTWRALCARPCHAAPAHAPPPPPLIPKVERRQSHPDYWLTVVYETIPPGGNVLTPERLAYIREVEGSIRAVAGYDEYCHLVPPGGYEAGVYTRPIFG